jgi:hypothetical protein
MRADPFRLGVELANTSGQVPQVINVT